jgi:hemoglobin/transferrin/lactoferrin receptor protein
MKLTYTLLCLIVFITGARTQSIKIIDEYTRQPVENVAVYNIDHSYTTLSNVKGIAEIKKFNINDTLVFQHPSYKVINLLLSEIEKMDFIVILTKKSYDLNEVIISASKWEQDKTEVPNKIITISAKEVAFNNPQTSADLLGNTHQIFIQKSQLGGGSPMIRGFAANSVLLVVDGVRMNNTIFRSGNLQNVILLDPNIIANAEVIFGPGSIIYGSDALGGVIDFHTRQPALSTGKRFETKANILARYSSADNERTGHIDVNLSTGKWGFLTSITTGILDDLRMGGYRHDDYLRKYYAGRINGTDVMIKNDEERVQKYSGYDQLNLMQKVRFKPNNNLDITYGFHFSETSDIPRYDRLIQYKNDSVLKYSQWYYGPQRWMLHNLNTRIKKRNTFFDEAKITLAYQDYQESRHSRKFDNDYMKSREEAVSIFSGNLDLERQFRKNNFVFYGFEAIYNNVKSTAHKTNIINGLTSTTGTRYPDGNNDYLTLAGYLSYKRNFGDKLTLITGIRYNYISLKSTIKDTSIYHLPFDKIELVNSAVNGSIGMTFRPGSGWQLNTNLSSGFRAPNLDDVAKVFDSEPGNVVVPNPGLKPEYAYNLDLGFIKRFEDIASVEATVFYTFLIDAMVRRDFTFNGKDSIFYDGELSKVEAVVNTGKAQIYGGSFMLNSKLWRYFSLSATITYTRGEDGDGIPMRHVSPLFGNTTIIFKIEKFKAELFTNFNGEISNKKLTPSEQAKPHMYASDKNGHPYAPAWWTLNFKSSYEIGEALILDFGIGNILDQRYRPYSSGIVAPGRNLIIGIRARF